VLVFLEENAGTWYGPVGTWW